MSSHVVVVEKRGEKTEDQRPKSIAQIALHVYKIRDERAAAANEVARSTFPVILLLLSLSLVGDQRKKGLRLV